MTETHPQSPSRMVRWGIYVVEDNRLRRPDLVGPDEELVLLAEVRPAPARLAVELYRGEALRDRKEWVPAAGVEDAVVALGLGRGRSLSASARLRCRLLIDGRLADERTVLLGRPAVDAQGRLSAASAALPSEATRLAYARLIEDWQSENGA